MALIKSLKSGQTEIEFYDDFVPEDLEQKRKNLIELYDTVNRIAQEIDHRKTKSWFISAKELKEMQKSEEYNFL